MYRRTFDCRLKALGIWIDLRPPSREIRVVNQDYRSQLQELRPLNQDYKLCRSEVRPPTQEFKQLKHDIRSSQDVVSLNNIETRQINGDNRPPSREVSLSDYRYAQPQEQNVNYDIMQLTMHDAFKMQEASRLQNVDVRNADRIEAKHTKITKQSIAESIKHTVVRKMVVGGPGFRSIAFANSGK